MSREADPLPDGDAPPTSESWYVGRRKLGVTALVVACLSAGVVVFALTSGGFNSTGLEIFFVTTQGLLAVTFTFQALDELRARITVDRDGVHRQAALRRRTYRWDEIAEIRQAGVLWGGPYLELVRHDDEVVALPKSVDRLHLLRRWHTAATGPS